MLKRLGVDSCDTAYQLAMNFKMTQKAIDDAKLKKKQDREKMEEEKSKLKKIWANHMIGLTKKKPKYSQEEIEMQNKWRTRLSNQKINDEVSLDNFKPKYSPEKRKDSESHSRKRKSMRNI